MNWSTDVDVPYCICSRRTEVKKWSFRKGLRYWPKSWVLTQLTTTKEIRFGNEPWGKLVSQLFRWKLLLEMRVGEVIGCRHMMNFAANNQGGNIGLKT